MNHFYSGIQFLDGEIYKRNNLAAWTGLKEFQKNVPKELPHFCKVPAQWKPAADKATWRKQARGKGCLTNGCESKKALRAVDPFCKSHRCSSWVEKYKEKCWALQHTQHCLFCLPSLFLFLQCVLWQWLFSHFCLSPSEAPNPPFWSVT